ncbi:YciI family protein [Streptomyces hebeiensis]
MPRFLSVIRVNEDTAPACGPTPELMERMSALLEEMTKAGAMLDNAGLKPTSEGARVRHAGGRTTVVDGPFAESKEVVGGYSLVQAKDLAEAVEWSRRFAELHGDEFDLTVEVREVVEG